MQLFFIILFVYQRNTKNEEFCLSHICTMYIFSVEIIACRVLFPFQVSCYIIVNLNFFPIKAYYKNFNIICHTVYICANLNMHITMVIQAIYNCLSIPSTPSLALFAWTVWQKIIKRSLNVQRANKKMNQL
jgi:hypothetical protein